MKDLKIVILIVVIVAIIWIVGCVVLFKKINITGNTNEITNTAAENQTGYEGRLKEILKDEKEIEKKWLIDKEMI